MRAEELIFDQEMEMLLQIPEQEEELYLSVSDDLLIYEEESMGPAYKERILTMLSLSNQWYPLAQERLEADLAERGRLMAIYLLSEQTDADFIFGLLFGVKADSEHGRGMKLRLDPLEILDYGLADVAFC